MRLAAASVLVGVALAWPAAALADKFFKTPSGNLVCQQVDARHRLECAALSSRHGSALPVYTLRRRGRAGGFTSHGNPATDVPVLGYGKRKRLLGGAVVCVSRTSGLRCRNRSGHGFFLSRGDQHRF